jgi:hypothetical protein
VPEHDAIAALVERVVAGACIAGRRDREDLRRELLTHFEDAGSSPDAIAFAIRRFGDDEVVSGLLRRVYRWEYLALYLVKVAASVLASCGAALLIVAAFNLRLQVETAVWHLAPGFSRAAGPTLAVTCGLIAVWELVRRPFRLSRSIATIAAYAAACALMRVGAVQSLDGFIVPTTFVMLGCVCSRLPSPWLRWLLTFVAFAVGEYGVHALLSVTLPASRAMMAGALLAAVWASTVFILRYVDAAFTQLVDATPH